MFKFKKTDELLQKYGRIIVGAKVDWYFTATELEKDDVQKIISGEKYILLFSTWDKFIARIDTGEEFDVNIEADKETFMLGYRRGFVDGIFKAENMIYPRIYTQVIKKLKYEDIKKLESEIRPILEKYKKIAELATAKRMGYEVENEVGKEGNYEKNDLY